MRELPTPFTDKRMGRADAERLAATMRALADPTRLQLLSILWSHPAGEASQLDLRELLGRALTQPTVSHHIGILEAAGFVTRRPQGIWVMHRLTPDGVTAVAVALRPGGGR